MFVSAHPDPFYVAFCFCAFGKCLPKDTVLIPTGHTDVIAVERPNIKYKFNRKRFYVRLYTLI